MCTILKNYCVLLILNVLLGLLTINFTLLNALIPYFTATCPTVQLLHAAYFDVRSFLRFYRYQSGQLLVGTEILESH